jgi:Rha family phage regulatory protein
MKKGGNMNELVQLKNDEAVCSSLDVAEKFHKRHDNVLQGIRGLLKNEDTHKMFKLSHYVEKQNGQSYPMYLMNRDGFSLLVMGFTGKAALEWKLKYIEAFNKMETIIREKSTETWLTSRQTGKLTRKSETDVIKELVEYAKAQGSTHADMLYMTYTKLANKMVGITDRDTASVVQLNRLDMMEQIILCIIREGMAVGLGYKEIYQNCKERLELVSELAYLRAIEQKGA